jgi:hypothetical protein
VFMDQNAEHERSFVREELVEVNGGLAFPIK